jgi:hypothetical protein
MGQQADNIAEQNARAIEIFLSSYGEAETKARLTDFLFENALAFIRSSHEISYGEVELGHISSYYMLLHDLVNGITLPPRKK